MKYVKLIKRWMDHEDNVHEPETELELNDELADELVKDGRAEIIDEPIVKKSDGIDVKAEIKSAVSELMTEIKAENKTEAPTIEVIKDEGDAEFKSMGDFLEAVVKAESGDMDVRLLKASGQSEGVNADGGYLVQHSVSEQIVTAARQESVLFPKTAKMQISGNNNGVKLPQVNESVRSNTSLFGGIRIYGPAEAASMTPSKQGYSQLDISLSKLVAVNYVTEELLSDSTALESFVGQAVSDSFAWSIDNEILNGSLGVMTGLVGHTATVAITVAGNNPTRDEWMNLYGACAPGHRNRAEWFISNSQFSALPSLEDDSSRAIYQPDYRVSPSGTLLGRPVNIIEQAGTDVVASSIVFADLSTYQVIERGGLEKVSSIHVRFLEGEIAFRFTLRIGGSPLLPSAITLLDDTVISPIVTRNTA